MTLATPAPAATPGAALSAGAVIDAAPLRPLVRALGRVRSVARLMLAAQALAWPLAGLLAALLALGVLDYAWRLPGWMRAALVAGLLAIVLARLARRVARAWRFRPPLAELARRLERSRAGEAAGAAHWLTTGVDLAELDAARAREPSPAPAQALTARLAAPVMLEAARRAAGLGTWQLLRPGRVLAAAAALAGAVLAIGIVAASRPALAGIGAQRLLLPFGQAAWPKRFDAEDATALKAHPLGTALPLRAVVAGVDAEGGRTVRVEARYRLIDASGRTGPTRRLVLTSQDRVAEAAGVRGLLLESLVEPGALAPSPLRGREASAADGRAGAIEYWFTTDDDQTPPARVELVEPPVVREALARLTPPAYAPAAAAAPGENGADGADQASASAGEGASLGAGADDRAIVGPVLEGTQVVLTLRLNKPVAGPPALAGAGGGAGADGAVAGAGDDAAAREAARAWFSQTLGDDVAALASPQTNADADADAEPGLTFSAQGPVWTLSWTARRSVRVPVRPVDEHGIGTDRESVFRVDVRSDAAPEATITLPAEDQEVLATARVEVAGEARDDVGLDTLAARARVARRPAGSEGAEAQTAQEAREGVELARAVAAAEPATPRLSVRAELDLSTLALAPGDEVWLNVIAADRFVLDGRRHEPTISAPRKLRVISPEQLVEQVWAELGAVRRSTIRLAEQQAEAARRTGPAADEAELASASRQQGPVGEGALRQAQAVERLAERLRDNQLPDATLAEMLERAGATLRQAEAGSSRAGEALARARAARAQGRPEDSARAAGEAGDAQQQTQEALEDVAALLDQGQDAWAARRGVERLLEEQRALREQTQEAAREQVGRREDELTPAERAATQELAQRQEDLARRADEAIRALRGRAEQLRERDPSAAAGLESAAQRGQQGDLREQLRQASRDLRENRPQRAQGPQDRSVRTLEQMLEQMENAASSRDQVLARELGSLLETLEALIARQNAELAALTRVIEQAGAAGAGGAGGLDAGMIRLRAATLAAADQARAVGREAREAARQIDDAAGAQGQAVVALRAEPADLEAAQTQERAALLKLEEARRLTQTAQEQAQARGARRQRTQLRREYAELLTAQTDLRTRTRDLEAMPEGRRRRAGARDLAPDQEALLTRARDLAQRTGEIGESAMFSLAQERLERAQGRAGTELAEGRSGAAVTSPQTTAIRALQAMMDALGEADGQEDFREGPQEEQGGGGGGGGAGGQNKLIPPAAELKLLRAMQAEALAVTREAQDALDAGRGDEAGAASVAEAAALQAALAERTQRLLEQLKEQSGPGGDGDGDGDGGGEGGGEGGGGGDGGGAGAPEGSGS